MTLAKLELWPGAATGATAPLTTVVLTESDALEFAGWIKNQFGTTGEKLFRTVIAPGPQGQALNPLAAYNELRDAIDRFRNA